MGSFCIWSNQTNQRKKYVKALENYYGKLLLIGINYDKNTKKHACIIETYIITNSDVMNGHISSSSHS